MTADPNFLTLRSDWAARRLGEGLPHEEIIAGLVRAGLDRETAVALLKRVIEQRAPRRESAFGRFRRAAPIVAGFLLIFGLGNLILYEAQEWYHADEVRTCEEIRQRLDSLSAEITSLEQFIRNREQMRAEMDLLDGLRSASPGNHRATSERLAALTAAYEADAQVASTVTTRYESAIAAYNAAAQEYNTLSKSAYSRWLLIPGVGGRHGEHAEVRFGRHE